MYERKQDPNSGTGVTSTSGKAQDEGLAILRHLGPTELWADERSRILSLGSEFVLPPPLLQSKNGSGTGLRIRAR